MNEIDKDYPVVLEQNVFWGDMDAFRHVNNTKYFRYFEDGKIAYFERIGALEHMAKANVGPILANAHCNFRLPLEYPDRIHIDTRAIILSPRKLNMEYIVYSKKHQAVAAEGKDLIVYYDYTRGKSSEIPVPIVAAIEALEGMRQP